MMSACLPFLCMLQLNFLQWSYVFVRLLTLLLVQGHLKHSVQLTLAILNKYGISSLGGSRARPSTSSSPVSHKYCDFYFLC